MKKHIKLIRAALTALALLAGIVGMTQPATASCEFPGPRIVSIGGGRWRPVSARYGLQRWRSISKTMATGWAVVSLAAGRRH